MIDKDNSKRLSDMKLFEIANETSSESPAPGGGSISAYCGSMGAALGTMVANLSAHKRGWDDKWEEFSNWAEKGITFQNELLRLVAEDTNASYTRLSTCARGDQTDLPLDLFNILYCNALSSVATGIIPPSTSISFTICPFANPPIAGLHDILPIACGSIVTRAVLMLNLFNIRAASTPAWPAPHTTASKPVLCFT